jgi:hypothetical protein
MKMKPNWKKAPEGATHYYESSDGKLYLKLEHGEPYFYPMMPSCDGEWHKYNDVRLGLTRIERAIPRPVSKSQRIADLESQVSELVARVGKLELSTANNNYVDRMNDGVAQVLKVDLSEPATECAVAGGVSVGFHVEPAAYTYADAFQVLVELRECEGVVGAKNNTGQFVIEISDDLEEVFVCGYVAGHNKCRLSPCFSGDQSPVLAIEKVGRDRIVRAFRFLMGVE